MKLHKSASRVVDIMELLSSSEEPMSLTEVCTELSIPKTSTYEIIQTLVNKELLVVSNDKLKTYSLGIKTFTIGLSYIKKNDLISIAHNHLIDMMKKSNSTVYLAVESNAEIVYLDKVDVPHASLRPSATLGVRRSMTCTGLGKAILASYDFERVKKIVDSIGFIRKTHKSICSFNELIKDIEKIRTRGFAIDDREIEEEIFCVAAPIYDYSRKTIAAISIASISFDIKEEKKEELGRLVSETALLISKKMGFQEDKLFKF